MPGENPSIRTFDALQSHRRRSVIPDPPGADNAGEFRPTLERVPALKSPAVIEIPVDDRDNLPLVRPMELRTID